MTASWRDRLVDVALLGGAALAFALLVAVAKMVVVYIACGLVFMAVAAYTVRARQRTATHARMPRACAASGQRKMASRQLRGSPPPPPRDGCGAAAGAASSLST